MHIIFDSPATSAPRLATFGQGTGDIILDDLQCVGTEANLFECPHSGVNVHNCVHAEDAGVVCMSKSVVRIFLTNGNLEMSLLIQ